MSARSSSLLCVIVLAFFGCKTPDRIRAEPDAAEWVIEIQPDGGLPAAIRGPAGSAGDAVVHGAPDVPWMAVVRAMDQVKEGGGRGVVLAAGAARRTKVIAFPRASAHVLPAVGERPQTHLVRVHVAEDGTPGLGAARGIADVRGGLAREMHEGGLPTMVAVDADPAASFARVLDVVDLAQALGLPLAFMISVAAPAPPPR